MRAHYTPFFVSVSQCGKCVYYIADDWRTTLSLADFYIIPTVDTAEARRVRQISAIRLLLSSVGSNTTYYFRFSFFFSRSLARSLLLSPFHHSASASSSSLCHYHSLSPPNVAAAEVEKGIDVCGFVDICGFLGKPKMRICECGSTPQQRLAQADKSPAPRRLCGIVHWANDNITTYYYYYFSICTTTITIL